MFKTLLTRATFKNFQRGLKHRKKFFPPPPFIGEGLGKRKLFSKNIAFFSRVLGPIWAFFFGKEKIVLEGFKVLGAKNQKKFDFKLILGWN